MSTEPIRLLVCGGRDYRDRAFLFDALDRCHAKRPIAAICHGGATGADTLADEWAKARDIPATPFPADWSLGRKAGPLRNAQMLEEFRPDGVVAFPGGRGTLDMVKRAMDARVKVWLPASVVMEVPQ